MHQAKGLMWAGTLAGLLALAGCSVNVNKDENGKEKDVGIKTPFGGVQVHKGDSNPVDTGLPAYPGAMLVTDDGNDGKSVDLQMGFGPWQIHVQAANYMSHDPQEKVVAFYQHALSRYGDVLTCRGNTAIGPLTRTSQGLSCKQEGTAVNVTGESDLELKAGSERKQHIVSFDDKKKPSTHFALVALSLPAKDSGTRGRDAEE